MDNYITNDPNNPINYNGKDIKQCNVCHNDLNTPEEEEEKLCFECIEQKETEKEERKELEKQFMKFPELEEKYTITHTDKNFNIIIKLKK